MGSEYAKWIVHADVVTDIDFSDEDLGLMRMEFRRRVGNPEVVSATEGLSLNGLLVAATESEAWAQALSSLHHMIFPQERSKGWTGSVRRISVELRSATRG